MQKIFLMTNVNACALCARSLLIESRTSQILHRLQTVLYLFSNSLLAALTWRYATEMGPLTSLQHNSEYNKGLVWNRML